jgi:hypothetical protein
MIVQFSKEQRTSKFAEVEPGDVFLDNMVVYMKIQEVRNLNGTILANAICLDNGQSCSMADYNDVVPVSGNFHMHHCIYDPEGIKEV